MQEFLLFLIFHRLMKKKSRGYSKIVIGKAVCFYFNLSATSGSICCSQTFQDPKDLWSENLNKIDSLNGLFKARPDEFRQIIIVKIMECRWLPKLQEYVITKLCPSQTAFVLDQGVFINIFRTCVKHHISRYINFKIASNFSTRRDLLFERSWKVIDKDDI